MTGREDYTCQARNKSLDCVQHDRQWMTPSDPAVDKCNEMHQEDLEKLLLPQYRYMVQHLK